MGFFSRLWRIIRGRTNDAVESIEDRNFEAVIRQNIRDLETELNRVIKASAEAMSNYNRLEAEYQKFSSGANEWHEKAKKALGAGNEDLARKALAKKSEFDTQVNNLRASVEAARGVKEKLKSQVDNYRTKIDDAKRNASTLIARQNAAQAQKKVAEVLAGIQNDSAFASLARFEEKVAKQEATALAFEEIGMNSKSALEAEFAALDTTNVDAELDALRTELRTEQAQGKRM